MADVAELGMAAVQNHDKILHPQQSIHELKDKKKQQEDEHQRRQSERHDGYSRHDQYDGRNERQRYDQRDRQDQRGRDQELPLGGYARRPGMNRRVSSLDRDRFDRRRGDSRYSDSGASTDTEEISSCEDDKKVRRMKGKQVLTAGLATIATLHAGKKVYDSFGATHKRHKAVRQGKMTQEEADKKKYTSRIMETASIGLAALGLKGVYDEWKEVQGERKEYAGAKEKRERHRQKQGKVESGSGSRRGSRYGDGRRDSGSGSESRSRSRDRYGDGELSRRQGSRYDGDGRGDRYGEWDESESRNRYGAVDGRRNQYGDGSRSGSRYGDDYGRRTSVPNLRDR